MQEKEDCQSSIKDDLGFGDEIKEEDAMTIAGGISPKSFYPNSNSSRKKKNRNKASNNSVMSAIANNRLKIDSSLNLNCDPKIMFQQVKVKLEKLPLKEVMAANEAKFSKINVSPPRKRTAKRKTSDDWFAAKRSRKNLSLKSSDAPCSSSSDSPRLIRPAILTVAETAQKELSKFSPCKKTEDAATAFLPLSASASSYLFGGGSDDFERVPDDEIIIDDDEDDDDEDDSEDDDDIEVLSVLEKVSNREEEEKEGYEAEAPVLSPIQPLEIKEEERSAVEESSSSSVPPTIPLLARLKKEETQAAENKIRFPAPCGNGNMIECKWTNCQMNFTTYGKLSDHLRVRKST